MGGKGHRQEKGWHSDPMDTFQVRAPRKSTWKVPVDNCPTAEEPIRNPHSWSDNKYI